MSDAAHSARALSAGDHPTRAPGQLDVAFRVLAATGAGAAADLVVLHRHDDGSLTAIVADVCGHGDQAAATATYVRPVVDHHVRRPAAPNILLERINADLSSHVEDGGFLATAIAATVDPGRRVVSWASAGHAPPHLLGSGRAINGAVPGPPIGVRAFVGCTTGSCHLPDRGDGVLLFTDGLTDVKADDGSRFGAARVSAALADLGSQSAHELVDELKRLALSFGGGQLADDVGLLVVRLP